MNNITDELAEISEFYKKQLYKRNFILILDFHIVDEVMKNSDNDFDFFLSIILICLIELFIHSFIHSFII